MLLQQASVNQAARTCPQRCINTNRLCSDDQKPLCRKVGGSNMRLCIVTHRALAEGESHFIMRLKRQLPTPVPDIAWLHKGARPFADAILVRGACWGGGVCKYRSKAVCMTRCYLLRGSFLEGLQMGTGAMVGLAGHEALSPRRQAGEGLCQLHHGPTVVYVPSCLMRLR